MMCVAYGSDPLITYSGGSSGNVFIWQELKLSKTVKAHDGPCFAMHSLDKVSMDLEYTLAPTVLFCEMKAVQLMYL